MANAIICSSIVFIVVHLAAAFTSHTQLSASSSSCRRVAYSWVKQQKDSSSIKATTHFSSKSVNENTNAKKYVRQRSKLGDVPIISRTVPVSIDVPEEPGTETIEVTVWEMEKPSEIIQTWWSVEESDRAAMGDPFGVVMWPGSIVASKELMKNHHCNSPSKVENSTVLVLGAGTGVESQVAARLGAGKVIATDINQLTLKLLDFSSEQSTVESRCKLVSSFNVFVR